MLGREGSSGPLLATPAPPPLRSHFPSTRSCLPQGLLLGSAAQHPYSLGCTWTAPSPQRAPAALTAAADALTAAARPLRLVLTPPYSAPPRKDYFTVFHRATFIFKSHPEPSARRGKAPWCRASSLPGTPEPKGTCLGRGKATQSRHTRLSQRLPECDAAEPVSTPGTPRADRPPGAAGPPERTPKQAGQLRPAALGAADTDCGPGAVRAERGRGVSGRGGAHGGARGPGPHGGAAPAAQKAVWGLPLAAVTRGRQGLRPGALPSRAASPAGTWPIPSQPSWTAARPQRGAPPQPPPQ